VIADPVLTLSWLVLAHLVADFVVQTDRIATDKFTTGRRAWRALGAHVIGVAVCLLPVVLAFGVPGLAYLVAVVVAHGIIDRLKVVTTRHVEAVAIARAHHEHEIAPVGEGLGSAWTPLPAALFVGDQLAHLVVSGGAWAIWLAGAQLTGVWLSVAGGLSRAWDPTTVHQVILVGIVLTDLAIVNVRAAALFVATLVHPREVVTGHHDHRPQDDATHGDAAAARPGSPSPARIGATIGVLERILIVAFVLTGAEAAIGFVVAAKTLARFKQLNDRPFAEYYLLGTLASVSVALVTGLLAQAALR
jgi:uncharacterized protein DUF3307